LVLLVVLAGLAGAAPVVDRFVWSIGERSGFAEAMASYDRHGCAVCHGGEIGGVTWRHDGSEPAGQDAILDAVRRGRPLAPGFAAAMPAFASRLSASEVNRLGLAVSMLGGTAVRPTDPELEVGREIALDMGCFRCHGPIGAGGVANPYSRGGRIPGFHGASFEKAVAEEGGLEQVVRAGRAATRAWWTPWARPSLDMPAYGDRLDSVELGLLVRYLQWLNDQDATGDR
jgi:mono/diheme cytochrome c family protein